MTEIDFGVLTPLMQDEKVTRITVASHAFISIWHNDRGMEDSDISFEDEAAVHDLAERIAASADMPFDYQHPITDVRLPDGTRVMLIHRYISSGGTVLRIEKAFDDGITLEKIISLGAISQDAADFLLACVKGHRKLAFIGGYHSGRKTGLNAISRHIPLPAPTVIIQPFNTIHLPEHRNVVKLESQQSSFMNVPHLNNQALLEAGLRLKPHRLIVAELDGTEVNTLLTAMQNGLDTFFSMGAVDVKDAIKQLGTMATANNLSRPVISIREQIVDSLDVIVHVDLMMDGLQRFVSISCIEGMQGDSIKFMPVFEREHGLAGGDLKATGNIPERTLSRIEENGIEVDRGIFEI